MKNLEYIMSSVKPLEGVILNPDVARFTEARKQFGWQQEAGLALNYNGQSMISMIETGKITLCPRAYSLMLLLGRKHDNYELVAKKKAKTIADFVIEPDDGLENASYYMLKLRSEAGMTQSEFAEVLGASENTIKSYENGSGQPSVRFYSIMALVFGVHPFFYLKKHSAEDVVDDTEE